MDGNKMELKMIKMKDIVTNPLQPRQEFNREKIQELANSIKEAELLQPIVVRDFKGKYEIVAGERRYKAFQILKEPKIPAIVRNIKDDTDALEKSLIENLQRDDLTSVERENAIGDLWDSGNYKSGAELARKLGLDKSMVTEYIAMKKDRKRMMIKSSISTTTLRQTESLPDKSRKKLIDKIDNGKIKTQDIREITQKLKEFPEEEQQMEVIDRIVERKETHIEIEEHELKKDLEIAKGEREPERFVSDDPDEIRLNTLQEHCSNLLRMTPSNIKIIKNIKHQKEAIELLKKTMNHIHKLLMALGEVDVIE